MLNLKPPQAPRAGFCLEELIFLRKFSKQKIYFLILLTSIFFAGYSLKAQSNSGTARVWEEPLIIPTYELGEPNPNPMLVDWNRRKWRPVYPYAMLDNLTNRRTNKTYKAVYLENEYLKVTVLPELGGHLYAIYDKVERRDILYTNHVVKYAMVGIRGAWISGGVEWNFPDGHTLSTISPVDYVLHTDPDGSVNVTVGDTERVQGMQWAVKISLHPGRRVVETETTLNNRTETPGWYWYWSTAAAPAAGDLRFDYPMRAAYPHTFYPVYSFPKENGVDISTYREVSNDLSLFARDSKRDYFGIYYEKRDNGVIHVADHRQLPGKKTWTWGTDDAGKVWIDKLTDNDGQYVEFQAGHFETQLEHEFIAPHQVEHFAEFWYPVSGLGGAFTNANANAALRLTKDEKFLRLSVMPTASFDNAGFEVKAGDKTIHTEHVKLSPGKIFDSTIELKKEFASVPLQILFTTSDGQSIIEYKTDTPVDGNETPRPVTRLAVDSPNSNNAEQAWLEGINFAKQGNERAAQGSYLKALKIDPGFAPAETKLALSFYKSGQFEAAAMQLANDLKQNSNSGEAHYYLGLVNRKLNKPEEAKPEFEWCAKNSPEFSENSLYQLGEMMISAGDWAQSINYFSKALEINSQDIKTRTLLTMSLRLSGQLPQAKTEIEKVNAQMPTDYLALNERELIAKALNDNVHAEEAQKQLWSLLAREPDNILTLVFDYLAVGQTEIAKQILNESISRSEKDQLKPSEQSLITGTYHGKVYPMFYYTLGYLETLSGDKKTALENYQKGSQADYSLVFPHRSEEETVLRTAINLMPNDGRTLYYLGNLLASKNRGPEAVDTWAQAVRFDPKNAMLHRNLALGLWQVKNDKPQAVSEFRQAIRQEPADYHRYIELDRLLSELGNLQERIDLFENAPAQVKSTPAISQSFAAVLIDANRFRQAADLLEQTKFNSGEGEYVVLGIYRRAHLGMAKDFQKTNRQTEAAAEFLKATEYPTNLGAGRPAYESLAAYYVAAAKAFELAGKNDEAKRYWTKAATDELNSPTQPFESWSENYYWKAIALDHIGKKGEAQNLFVRLANLANDEQMLAQEKSPPEGAVRWVLAGAGLKALGHREEARLALEKALQLDAGNELAKSELRDLNSDLGRKT